MRTGTTCVALALAVSLATPGRAEDTEARKAIQSTSSGRGLGHAEVPVIRRLPGPGIERGLAVALERLAAVARLEGSAERRDARGRTSLRSEAGWFLAVGADGDELEYRDDRLANASVWEQAAPMPLDELVAGVDSLRNGPLSELFPLGPEESLVPIHVAREERGLRDAQGVLLAETVAVNILEYARVVRGVPVLGNGSRLRIGLSPRGEVVLIEAAWPRLEISARGLVAVSPIEEVRGRQAVLRKVLGVSAEAEQTRFECGYRDTGDDPILRPGCYAAFRSSREGSTIATDFWIPAARVPTSASDWPELELLKGEALR